MPDDVATIRRLAEALIVRARASADPNDTSRAEALADRAVALAPKDASAWNLKAWSEMNAHRFTAALAAARKAQALGAANAVTHGLIADALVELGRYREAIEITGTMLERFPGLPAYARAAHLRFLHGDLEGAIELTRQAVRAGRPHTEETAWALVQLSELYLHDGNMELAAQAAEAALRTYPGLTQGDAQLARVREAQGQYEDALALYARAAQIQPSPELVFPLWRLARRLDKETEAKRQAELLKALAQLDEKRGLSRRVLSLFFAEVPRGIEIAEQLARRELKDRPDIYSHDTLAWVLYRAGKLPAAREHALAALRLGTQDVAIKYHAALILKAAGDAGRGDALLAEARTRAPHLEPR